MSEHPASIAAGASIGQVQMAAPEALTLALLAERIVHEREARLMAAAYERELREKTDAHERETRELVTRLEENARVQEASRIEDRLEVLNNERQRQENDRQTFATRGEVDISLGALGERTTLALRELSAAVTLLKEQRERDLGRQSGASSVTGFIAPNLGSIVAIGVAIVTLILLFTRQG